MDEIVNSDELKKGKTAGGVSDLYTQIQDESSWLGKLLSKVPGLKGYMETSRRREADQMLRYAVANRLEEVRLRLARVQEDMSHDIILAIDYAEPVGRVDNRLMGLIGKIKDAPVGYSGFFDAVKIDAEDMQAIYQFDESMLHHADILAAQVEVLSKAVNDGGDVAGALRELDNAVKEANTAFAGRQELLAGLS